MTRVIEMHIQLCVMGIQISLRLVDMTGDRPLGRPMSLHRVRLHVLRIGILKRYTAIHYIIVLLIVSVDNFKVGPLQAQIINGVCHGLDAKWIVVILLKEELSEADINLRVRI